MAFGRPKLRNEGFGGLTGARVSFALNAPFGLAAFQGDNTGSPIAAFNVKYNQTLSAADFSNHHPRFHLIDWLLVPHKSLS